MHTLIYFIVQAIAVHAHSAEPILIPPYSGLCFIRFFRCSLANVMHSCFALVMCVLLTRDVLSNRLFNFLANDRIPYRRFTLYTQTYTSDMASVKTYCSLQCLDIPRCMSFTIRYGNGVPIKCTLYDVVLPYDELQVVTVGYSYVYNVDFERDDSASLSPTFPDPTALLPAVNVSDDVIHLPIERHLRLVSIPFVISETSC